MSEGWSVKISYLERTASELSDEWVGFFKNTGVEEETFYTEKQKRQSLGCSIFRKH